MLLGLIVNNIFMVEASCNIVLLKSFTSILTFPSFLWLRIWTSYQRVHHPVPVVLMYCTIFLEKDTPLWAVTIQFQLIDFLLEREAFLRRYSSKDGQLFVQVEGRIVCMWVIYKIFKTLVGKWLRRFSM